MGYPTLFDGNGTSYSIDKVDAISIILTLFFISVLDL